jgi:nucleotide-binding universal stress UspA family protein
MAKTMIKDIVVNLSVGEASDAGTEYAVSVAAAFQAHLAGIGFVYEPVVYGSPFEGSTAGLIDAERARRLHAAKTAVRKLEESARRNGISIETRLLEANFANAGDQFGVVARRFDLSIITQAEPRKLVPEEMIIESALFNSGRPVLVVPYIQKTGLKLDHVMVCWDGSRNAARATADAIPFLSRAKSVDVVMITNGERAKSDELPGADIAQHLARHGLNIEVKRITAVDTDVPNAILSYAADIGADFMVMGGYGHSRLREFVLGGATRGVLGSMTVPTLMSH